MIELIVIGKEILAGDIVEMNHQYLALKLREVGLLISRTTFIDDTIESIVGALSEATQRSTLIITSGGIGPTKDDVTKESLASFIRENLRESTESIDLVNRNYQRFNTSYNPKEGTYHLKTDSMIFHENKQGRAPLIELKTNQAQIFSFPGVPREFRSAVDELIINPYRDHKGLTLTKVLLHGINEADLFQKKSPNLFTELEELGSASSLPRPFGLIITLLSNRDHSSFLEKKFSTLCPEEFVAVQCSSLAEALINLACTKGITISTVESCTGGLIASQLTDIAGSSSTFLGSCVTYSNEAKVKLVGVQETTLQQWGAVSTQTAEQMAQGGAKAINSDLCVSTTGIAGPGGGSKEKPVGTVCISVSTQEKILFSERFQFGGDRESLKMRFASRALFCLFKVLKEIDRASRPA